MLLWANFMKVESEPAPLSHTESGTFIIEENKKEPAGKFTIPGCPPNEAIALFNAAVLFVTPSATPPNDNRLTSDAVSVKAKRLPAVDQSIQFVSGIICEKDGFIIMANNRKA